MKQKDLVLVIVISVVSAIFSLILSKAVIGTPESHVLKAEIVDKITSDFPRPDPRYFNTNSINPALPISVGDSDNNNPFNTRQ